MTVVSYQGLAAEVSGRKHARAWQLFVGLLVLASALPFAALPFSQHGVADPQTGLAIVAVITFLGANFHVGASAWFYTDGALWGHFREHRLRYLIVPALLIVGCAALFQFAPPVRGFMLAGFFSWQLWHYQKQNIGLLSFVAAGTDGVSVSIWERRTLMIAAVAGIAGYFSLNPIGLQRFAPEFALLHRAGALLYLAVPVAFAVALVKNAGLRRNPLRLVCLAFGAAFFLSTFLFDDMISATASYAMAHGLQYLVFMGFVAAGRPRPVPSLLMLVGLALLGTVVLNGAIEAPGLPSLGYGFALYGAFVGVTMSHFVLDAGLWRLREPFQRRYMREKFRFVFDR